MASSICNFVADRIQASSSNQQLAADSLPPAPFKFPMSTGPKCLPPPSTSPLLQIDNFFVESAYLNSVSRQDGDKSWKIHFSLTNRLLWTETLKLAVYDLLTFNGDSGYSQFIRDEGVHRYAELVEWAIFEYRARDPEEYGNEMGAKYDAIRDGEFGPEESKLLQHYAWLC